jgi:hypothetical protein
LKVFSESKISQFVEHGDALLADVNKQNQPFPGFADAIPKYNLQSGIIKERSIVTVKWTKDPAHAPAPGVYAALDIISRFENIDRYCGFLILYQATDGGVLRVMREESNFLDDATAKSIEQQHSMTGVDKAWAQLSGNCPNYRVESGAVGGANGILGRLPHRCRGATGTSRKPQR